MRSCQIFLESCRARLMPSQNEITKDFICSKKQHIDRRRTITERFLSFAVCSKRYWGVKNRYIPRSLIREINNVEIVSKTEKNESVLDTLAGSPLQLTSYPHGLFWPP